MPGGKLYYNVADIMIITENKKTWCYNLIRNLRKNFLNDYKDSIVPQGKIPIWYFEKVMKTKKEEEN